MLLGRVTYEGFAKAWSQRTGDDCAADETAISPSESWGHGRAARAPGSGLFA